MKKTQNNSEKEHTPHDTDNKTHESNRHRNAAYRDRISLRHGGGSALYAYRYAAPGLKPAVWRVRAVHFQTSPKDMS